MTDAAVCRANGWGSGSVLESVEEPPVRVLITAVGRDLVLGEFLGEGGEVIVSLAGRQWRRIGVMPF